MTNTNNPYNPLFLIDYHNNETFHSKLIKLFLDVNNCMDCDDFEKKNLTAFIQLLNKKLAKEDKIAEYDKEEDGFFFIHNEYSIIPEKKEKKEKKHNYFDIFISYGTTAIVIENKLDAKDGKGQLKRYRKWLNDKSNLPGIDIKNRHLIYLTKKGGGPKNDSKENIEKLTDSGLITLSWPDLVAKCLLKDFKSNIKKAEKQKKYFFKAMVNHLKLNFIDSNLPDPKNKKLDYDQSFLKKLEKKYLKKKYKDEGVKVKLDQIPRKTEPKKVPYLELRNDNWMIDGIQLYIIIYRWNSLGVFCGIKNEEGLSKKEIAERIEVLEKKYLLYIPQKKIDKSNEMLITGKNNSGVFEAHCIDLEVEKDKYVIEVDKRVKRIIMLIENEKDIRKKK